MNEDILSRARLLAKAANEVADQMTLQVDEFKSIIKARKNENDINNAIEIEKKIQYEKSRIISHNDVGRQKTVKGAAICGSTLITTYEDIRPFAPRGSTIIIDNISCKLKENGEWTANRVELETDYPGQTNLDAEIGAIITAEIVKKRSPKKNKAVPISSNDISSAVSNLDFGGLTSGRNSSRSNGNNNIDTQKKKKKTKIPLPSSSSSTLAQGTNKNSNSVIDSLSDYSRALLSSTSSNESHQLQQQNSARGNQRIVTPPPIYHQPNLEVNIQDENEFHNNEYDNNNNNNNRGFNSPLNSYQHSKPPLHQTNSNSTSNTLTSLQYQHSSPSARSILSNNSTSKFSTISKQSNNSLSSNTSNSTFPFSSSQQTVMTGSEIVAIDKNLEPEQIQMLYEIDDITPEEQLRKRYEMNLRMADRGQKKAVERVAQRRQLEVLNEELSQQNELQSNDSLFENRGTHISEEMLAEQRRLAFQRVAMKRQEEDKLIAEKLKKEEEEKLKHKLEMEKKAEKLKELTQQRVAEYKAMKKEKERKKREQKEAEEALKRERELECQSEIHLRKLQQRMAETEARLQKQKKELEDKKYLEKIEMETRLANIAEQRQRTKNIFTIPPPETSNNSGKDKNSDDNSKSSSVNSTKKDLSKKSLHVLPKLNLKKDDNNHNDNIENVENNDNVKVSIQTKAAHFLPGIRTSTSEQSNRSRLNNQSTKQNNNNKNNNNNNNNNQIKLDRHKSADLHHINSLINEPTINIIPNNQINHTNNIHNNKVNDINDEFDELDDYFSDDSLEQMNKKKSNLKQLSNQKNQVNMNIGVGRGNVMDHENSTIVSALTNDTALDNESTINDLIEKKKKKKRKVWKMEPIPVRPYVPVTNVNEK